MDSIVCGSFSVCRMRKTMREWIIQAETIGNISDGYWYGNGEEIVRCKNCKYYWKNYTDDSIPVCLASPKDDAFCSEGERKDEFEEPEINPCRGCPDYDGRGGCISNGGCGERKDDVVD